MKKEPPTVVDLEKFDMSSMHWLSEKNKKFHVEKDQFLSAVFRKAFKAADTADGSKWVARNIFSKSSQKYGRLRLDSRRSYMQTSATPFSSSQYCSAAPRLHHQSLVKRSNTGKFILDF